MNAFLPADILMPKTDHMEKWAVIACDQFTSDQAYWDRVRKNAEGAVSTINLILPEAELGTEKEAKHTAEINATMKKYMEDGVFTVYPNSFVYVERTLENDQRHPRHRAHRTRTHPASSACPPRRSD